MVNRCTWITYPRALDIALLVLPPPLLSPLSRYFSLVL